MRNTITRITPFLWFASEAEEAAQFYTSIFRNSRIRQVARYPAGAPGPAGSVMTVEFELDGQPFTALNGGPHFKFNESVSFVVHCKSQADVDYYWDRLLAGGAPSQCGWLKDRYGLSWQIVPEALLEWIADENPQRAQRVMQAMLTMVKLDLDTLQQAHAQS